ncbi:restriction endonuclease [Vibrio parahaemolyticus]|uniref:restriction endonuclease n=1 Tax=Vibrio parahaemolyticus TaxID=670 RepID=UPI000406AB04|nr:restriction endonuclease [Vibrio parahaemolyticus]
MKIDVACKKNSSNKAKGDLLEGLAKKLLLAQNYDVIEEIRIVGAELDLLCKHRVNGKEIYVECKAQKDPIAAPILRQLWGTVDFEEYSEGWLISTSDFTKDAKGFVESWKSKSKDKSERLSFYYPSVIIEALKSSSIISEPPMQAAKEFIGDPENLGDWTLLLSEYGTYWCIYTLKGGAPYGVLVYNASSGKHIRDEETIQNLTTLNTTIADYDLRVGIDKETASTNALPKKLPPVVQVQVGESWDDYRPARPEDFVGRDSTQKEILNFLNSAMDKSGTRIFAITGNSGLGKSSLIAKLRARSRNQHYRKKFFVYAVDIRGAREPSYIPASLIASLREAQHNGFGDQIELSLTDPSSPLNSDSIQEYLESLKRKGQVVCLVFDQFEELYSKPEMFGIFNAAKDLMLDVTSSQSNLVLGFAWKTDSTTQQDHPAYHLWHELADHRREYRLDVFESGEISNSITKFEREIDQKISAEIKHQISEVSQGFPWLLKKLCINLYEGLTKGERADSLLLDLDVERLFQADLNILSQQEHVCLKLIAQKAPADWSEIIETSGTTVLNNLVHKRLVIKSGDRLNIYWDIFKDYLLTGRVPVVPYNYIPTSDPSSLINVCTKLKVDEFTDSVHIGAIAGLNERTIWNIGADLVMLGLAERNSTSFKVSKKLGANDESSILNLLRETLGKHSLKVALFKNYSGKTITANTVRETFKECIPKAKFGEKTWNTYSNRLTNYLIYSGYLLRAGNDLVVQDTGTVILDRGGLARRGKQRGKVFSVSVSPFAAVSAFNAIPIEGIKTQAVKRNELAVLKRFELVTVKEDVVFPNSNSISKSGGAKEAIWAAAKNESSLLRCIEIIQDKPDISAKDIAAQISDEYDLNWSEGSKTRNGGTLKQWSFWVKEGMELSGIPLPPGRFNKAKHSGIKTNTGV